MEAQVIKQDGDTQWLFTPESVTHDDKGNWTATGTATQVSSE